MLHCSSVLNSNNVQKEPCRQVICLQKKEEVIFFQMKNPERCTPKYDYKLHCDFFFSCFYFWQLCFLFVMLLDKLVNNEQLASCRWNLNDYIADDYFCVCFSLMKIVSNI